jgi:mediator of RNA polymerase II transcription subunit 13
MVRKLKRKSVDQGGRECMKRHWRQDDDDFQSFKPECVQSEAESDDEMKGNDSPVLSRPSSPTPLYLPKGPTLLHARFQHSLLLPMTTPLRHPGAVVAPTHITSPPAAISVPTPVSPAAVIGAASEKSKSLAAAAQSVAREVVENAVWGDAWRATIAGSPSLKQSWDIWPADILVVTQLLDGIPGLENALSLAALLGKSQHVHCAKQ